MSISSIVTTYFGKRCQKEYCDASGTDQVTDQVSDQVADQVTNRIIDQAADQDRSPAERLLTVLGKDTLSPAELMERLGLSHRPTFRQNYLNPALEQDLIEAACGGQRLLIQLPKP